MYSKKQICLKFVTGMVAADRFKPSEEYFVHTTMSNRLNIYFSYSCREIPRIEHMHPVWPRIKLTRI